MRLHVVGDVAAGVRRDRDAGRLTQCPVGERDGEVRSSDRETSSVDANRRRNRTNLAHVRRRPLYLRHRDSVRSCLESDDTGYINAEMDDGAYKPGEHTILLCRRGSCWLAL